VKLINKLGPANAARQLGISRATLAAAAAGFPVSATTDDRIRDALDLAA
jgi:hypothetical protein